MAFSYGGNLVKEYSEKYPNLPNLTLAKLIYSENEGYFTSAERVRDLIRYQRGSQGDTNRFQRGLTENKNPWHTLPVSEEKDFAPFKLDLGTNRILWLSDIHIPYHSTKALEMAIEEGLKRDCNIIALMGDIWDCLTISKFTFSPNAKTLGYELQLVNQFLDYLAEKFPKARIILLEGNHEYRLKPYMSIKAPQLCGIGDFSWNSLLKLKDRGIDFVDQSRIILYDNLTLCHGHEIVKGGGTNKPAEKLYREAKANAICGHFHRTSSHTETNIHGRSVSTWTVGHLSEPRPEYLRYNKWNHGFAIIETCGTDWSVNNLKIIEGKIV